VPLGEKTAQGARCEDLTGLSVPDNSFDLVITSDVIDRLPDYRAALVETLRVLKPGGVHVFSVPNGFPFPERSRAALDTGDDPRSRLYTEFGGDLDAVIAELGGRLTVVRRSNMIAPCHANATFVLRKLAGQAAASPARVGDASRAQAPSSSGTLVCPICKGVSFEDFNGRKNARCCGCRSVERNRLMWMVLDRLDGFRAGARVLHIAPELFLARHFQQVSGPNYHACDDASRYVASKLIDVRPLDLCQDLGKIPDASYDLIIHSHVLARLPCDVEGVLRALNRLLAPGGRHIFSVPIRGLRTSEDQSPDLTEPDLTEAERKARFGHETHRRIFGAESLQEMLTAVWGPGTHLIEPIELFTRDELRVAGIPLQAWKGVSSHSLFQYQKEPLPS
jgi:SAM-dependent methyltransferase